MKCSAGNRAAARYRTTCLQRYIGIYRLCAGLYYVAGTIIATRPIIVKRKVMPMQRLSAESAHGILCPFPTSLSVYTIRSKTLFVFRL